MTENALGTRHQFQRGQALVLAMARRAGSIFNDVGFVKLVLLVADPTFPIDGLESDAVLKAITQDGDDFRA